MLANADTTTSTESIGPAAACLLVVRHLRLRPMHIIKISFRKELFWMLEVVFVLMNGTMREISLGSCVRKGDQIYSTFARTIEPLGRKYSLYQSSAEISDVRVVFQPASKMTRLTLRQNVRECCWDCRTPT